MTPAPCSATDRHNPTPITARPSDATAVEWMNVVTASAPPTSTISSPAHPEAANRSQAGGRFGR